MSAPFYLVLRNDADKVQTIGPMGAKFATFKEADAFAKHLRDQYTHQSFIVAQASAIYQTRVARTVIRFESEEKPAQKTVRRKSAGGRIAASTDENIVRMSPRKATTH